MDDLFSGNCYDSFARFPRLSKAILLAGMVLSTGQVCGFSISVSGDAGGFSEEIGAGINDYVNGYAAVWPGCLSNYIEGSGSLRESHRTANTAGSTAAVGVEIRDADSYVYSYHLSLGPVSF